MRSMTVTELVDTQYLKFSRYTLEFRAIPYLSDGLKPVVRRSLWTALKLAKYDYVKVAKLSGAVLSIHPHGSTSVDDCVSGMAQRFSGANNVNYFDGKGAFGSKIAGPGNAIGAARYVSVKLSENFHKIMGVDLDIVQTVPGYDDVEHEPVSFFPIVPTVLLNPLQGIAVGFACTILPRKLEDLVHCQIAHLNGKGFHEPQPYYDGFRGTITKIADNSWETKGVFSKSGRKLTITEVPIGYTRESYIRVLDTLEEKEIITSYTDECTDEFLFSVNLKADLNEQEIYEKFKLIGTLSENLTVIDFDKKVRKMTITEVIKEFTDQRFLVYFKRYVHEFKTNKVEYEFKNDLLKVIKKGLFKKFPDLKKTEIADLLKENEIKEVNIQKIIQTPIYRFGKEEVEKLEIELKELKTILERLVLLCKNPDLRKVEYMKELKAVK
jgi:DNA topoisomerase-2